MQILKHIPNFLTSLNLTCGSLAVFFALNSHIEWSAWLIFAGALFDFSDGFAARALKAYSDMGKELDSLADLISFGMAPAAIFSALIKYLITGDVAFEFDSLPVDAKVIVLLPFMLAVFSGLRLAKFNIDTRQTENFLGLTTTATGIFTASFAYMVISKPELFGWLNEFIIILMVVFFSIMLVSEVPMFSLKFKNFRLNENPERFLILAVALVSTIWLGVGGIAATILFYILYAILKWMVVK
ncbi:MAG: CDP-alcohol phosphatidyltransferase [Chlorobi bacterium]|nr:CDP-alcohol phosphatidyltransferase [Chlorobiota bacterium]